MGTVMNVREAAAVLRCSDKMVRKLFHTGVLKGYMVGRAFRICSESVDLVARGEIPSGRRDHRVKRL